MYYQTCPFYRKLGKNVPYHVGFPGDSDGKEFACSAGDPGSSLGSEDPLEKEMAIHSSVLG